MLTKEQKSEIVQKFGGKTGSPEVQVALMTARINYLTNHFASHKLDHHSKRGLMKLIGRRRRMLRYLNNADEARYKKVISELGLRK
jgi:small subunit ribosomal protein S15